MWNKFLGGQDRHFKVSIRLLLIARRFECITCRKTHLTSKSFSFLFSAVVLVSIATPLRRKSLNMMLKHKKSIISASGRPTAKINPFLESSFRGYFTVTDAVFVEVTNVGQKTGEVHGRINLFFKRNKRQIAGFHIAFQSKNKVSLNIKICAFLVFTFYEFREKFQVMELNEGAILSTLHCADALEIRKYVFQVKIMVTLPRFDSWIEKGALLLSVDRRSPVSKVQMQKEARIWQEF